MAYQMKNKRIKTQQQIMHNEDQDERQQYKFQKKNYDMNKSYDSSLEMPFGIQSSMTKDEQFLDRVLKIIKKQINYDEITQQDITQERAHLKTLIKQLNQKLNTYIFNSKNSRVESSTHKNTSAFSHHVKLKTSMAQATQLKYESILQQIHNNYKLLSIMKNQHSFLSERIKWISDPYNKLSNQSKIAQILTKIKVVKSQIGIIKSKKLQNQKNFIKGNKKQSILLNQLQQQNLNLMRKIQSLHLKYQQTQEQHTKLQNLSQKADQQYSFLKQLIQAKGLKTTSKRIILSDQHQKLIYQTNKRKLQLTLRKSERDQQNFKRRYYQLLSSLDKFQENQNQYEEKIIQTEQKASFIKDKMNYLKGKISNKISNNNSRVKKIASSFQNSRYKQNQSEQEDQYGNFMLTQIKQTKKIKLQNQNQYNQYNKNRLKQIQKPHYSSQQKKKKNFSSQKYLQNVNPQSSKFTPHKAERINKSLGDVSRHKQSKRYNKETSDQINDYSSNQLTPINKSYIQQKLQKIHSRRKHQQPQKYTQSQKQVQQISEDQNIILKRLLQKNMREREIKFKENLFKSPLEKYYTNEEVKSLSIDVPKLKTFDIQKKRSTQRNQYLKKSALKYHQIQEQIQYESIIQSIVPSARKQQLFIEQRIQQN